jgi:hypothetical protein
MKVLHRESAGVGRDSAASATENIPYLRVRPPFRRFEKERQQASYEHLRACEGYLKALNWYRDRLDNPGGRRAT